MITDLFHFFKGAWLFERTVSDSFSGNSAPASGKAVFTAEEEGRTLYYKEEGRLSVQAATETYPFFRHYRYLFDREEMQVYFADAVTGNNGLYQSYRYDAATGLLSATGGHQCSRDFYTGAYQIMDQDTFRCSTVVTGPKKDYTSDTFYTRKRV